MIDRSENAEALGQLLRLDDWLRAHQRLPKLEEDARLRVSSTPDDASLQRACAFTRGVALNHRY
jgi:hypothetical protein